jgi:hypothetical protein
MSRKKEREGMRRENKERDLVFVAVILSFHHCTVGTPHGGHTHTHAHPPGRLPAPIWKGKNQRTALFPPNTPGRVTPTRHFPVRFCKSCLHPMTAALPRGVCKDKKSRGQGAAAQSRGKTTHPVPCIASLLLLFSLGPHEVISRPSLSSPSSATLASPRGLPYGPQKQ